jgi:histone H3/H4
MRALMEIWKYKKNTDLLILKRPLSQLVREISQDIFKGQRQSSFCWTGAAMLAIHTALEDYMVKVFAATNYNTIHGRCVTIVQKDIKLTKTIRDIFNDN